MEFLVLMNGQQLLWSYLKASSWVGLGELGLVVGG